jgi:ribose/xylose/arabinose/galactoside ABC-type transport system permease subunit
MITNSRFKAGINTFLAGNKAIVIVILLIVVLAIASPVFLTSRNLLNVLRQVCVSTIIAVGFSLVLGSGEIDLSVGAIVGFVGIMIGKMLVAGLPVPVTIIIGILIGAAIGVVNATLITVFKLSFFIVTLAMMQILRGLCYLTTNMVPIINLPENFDVIGQGYLFAIPIPVYIMAAMVAIIWIVINKTRFGRYVLAKGGNTEAARVSGIDIVKVRVGAFATMGMCAAVASVVLTARAASAQATGGLNMEMDAIAAAVIGGTTLSGGVTNIIGAMFGSFIVGLVGNGLNLLGVNTNWQYVAKGLLILFAVILDSVSTSVYTNVAKRQSILKVK